MHDHQIKNGETAQDESQRACDYVDSLPLFANINMLGTKKNNGGDIEKSISGYFVVSR